MLPIIHAFGFSPEAQAMYPSLPKIRAWRERMEDFVWALINSPEFVFTP